VQVLRIAEGRLDFETLTYPDGVLRGPLVTSFEFMFVFLLFIITVMPPTARPGYPHA
jgi:hypothetical protein